MNESKPYKRILFDIVLFISAFIAPWWFTVVLALIGMCVFELYLELILVALILDALHGSFVTGHRFLYTISAIIIFTGFVYFKKKLRFYS